MQEKYVFCVNCGAPHEAGRDNCSYCLTLYHPYGTIKYSFGWHDPRQIYCKLEDV